jgi:hypothetical protein
MAMDLFGDAGSQSPLAKPLTVFRAELLSHDQVTWEELFDNYTALKAITFSSSLEFLLRLADRLDDMEMALLANFGPVVLADFGPPPSLNLRSLRFRRRAWSGLERESGTIRAATAGA